MAPVWCGQALSGHFFRIKGRGGSEGGGISDEEKWPVNINITAFAVQCKSARAPCLPEQVITLD